MVTPLVFACACPNPNCGDVRLVLGAEIHKPLTPRCSCRARETVDREFGAQAWSECRAPQLLRECLALLRIDHPARKMRLLNVALGSLAYNWCKNYWFNEAIAAGEEMADGEPSTRNFTEIQTALAPYGGHKHWARTDWVALGLACIAEQATFPSDGTDRSLLGLISETYRELLPNPFLPPTWQPAWFTSTVRDLATHIYAARDFGAMPILADALQDAGCDDEQVLTHCRADKPHARGCWVLDAVLGKG